MKDRASNGIGITGHLKDWSAINWQIVKKNVRNLRQRIFRATQNGQWNKVRSLMKLMLRNYSNLLLSVRKVTQENKGRKTPGIDNQVILTPKSRLRLVSEMLKLKAWCIKPAVRLYIPKASGKLRPLGILTIKNRVAQAVVKNALEPNWEARFESHSYGFRPGRSTHDAIEQCFARLNSHTKDKWVLDCDVKSAFDSISHCFILQKLGNTPGKELIKLWLKAGYVEEEVFHDTTSGVQQGGNISPVIANIALDGMQKLLGSKYGYIRYADDLVVTAKSKEALLAIKPTIEKWLLDRGLVMNDEKTRIVSVENGFNFLGFYIKTYRGKCLIKPEKEKVLALLKDIAKWLKIHRSAEAMAVVCHLNPLLRGWAQHYKYVVSSQTFSYVQHNVWNLLWHWCKRRHPNKSSTWIKRKYFQIVDGKDWCFFAKDANKEIISLIDIGLIAIERHRKVNGTASPDDPSLNDYWLDRTNRKHRRLAEADSLQRNVKTMLRARAV